MSGDAKVVLITGASAGIGKACAEHLARRGYRVYGTSRHASPEGSLEPAGFTLIRMDVTDGLFEWAMAQIYKF